MTDMNENAHLYVQKACYNKATGPYECLSKPWWIRTSAHRRYEPRHHCELTVLNCGQAVFKAIQADISAARKSVDIITWGFDPGMMIVREGLASQGIRYGDLLKEIATRPAPVLVRLLVWHDDLFSHGIMKNNPGYYGHRFPAVGVSAGYLSESHASYNAAWFDEIIAGKVPNIRLHIRDVPIKYKDEALADERYSIGLNGWLGSLYPSHHQKMVLVDYELPEAAVGYVMGHNSITDFWDTAEHRFQDPLRETLFKKNPAEPSSQAEMRFNEAADFFDARMYGSAPRPSRKEKALQKFIAENAMTAKPYQDVSLRARGPILHDLNHNFCEAWSESQPANRKLRLALWMPPIFTPLGSALDLSGVFESAPAKELERRVRNEPDPDFIQRRKKLAAAAFKLPNAHHSAQLLRTQPMHKEKGIKECYANLTRQLQHYLLIQNQYVQYEDWATHLKSCVQRLRSMGPGYQKPIYVFILTSTPESAGMDLPTYSVAKELGQSGTMVYEHDDAAKQVRKGKASMPITAEQLAKSGINVVMGSLWTCADNPKSAADYEEIYIHAKVAIVDDAAFTIGSANLNVRSMALDSELNVLSQAMDVACSLRKELFNHCVRDEGPPQFGTMQTTFEHWNSVARNNFNAMSGYMPLEGQLVLFHVNRKPAKPVI